MSDKIKNFMGAEEWKSLGRMGRGAGSAAASGQQGLVDQMDAVNRPGVYDNDQYDGIGSPMGDRPFQSYAWFGRADQTLGNPHGTSSMDDHTSGLSQFYHFLDILSQPGHRRLNLFNAAARAGNILVKDARDLGHPDANHTVVANSPQQARVIFAAIEAAVEQAPVDTRESQRPVKVASHHEESAERTIERNRDLKTSRDGRQVLPEGDADVDWAKFEKTFREVAKIKPMRSHTVKGQDGVEVEFRGVISIFSANRLEEEAARRAADIPADFIVAPAKNLWGEINSAKSQARIENLSASRIVRDTQVRENQAKFQARIEKLYDDKSKNHAAAEQVIDASDIAVFCLSNNYKSADWQAAGYAASQGKLGKVYDHESKEMNLIEARRMVLADFVSKQEFARSQSLKAFNIPINSPYGRLGLNLIRDEKNGKMSNKDIDNLAASGLSISEVADLATTEEGRKELTGNLRVSPKAVRLLHDEKTLANAASKLQDIRISMSKHNVAIIGPEDMPDSWPNKPPYLFVQGDASLLKDGTPLVGVIGDQIVNPSKNASSHALIASRSTPMIAALEAQDVRLVTVEDQLPFEGNAQNGNIKILASGHAVFKDAWHVSQRAADLNNGVLTISTLPPEGETFYNSKLKEKELSPSSETDHTVGAAARLLGKVSDEMVVTNFDRDDRRSPTREAIKTFTSQEKRPVAIDYTDTKNIEQVSGNNALATSRGEEAFRNAGFGDAFAQETGPAFNGSRPVILTGPKIAEAAVKLANKANGRDFNPVVEEKPKAKSRNEAQIF
jgi:hypothetical protein